MLYSTYATGDLRKTVFFRSGARQIGYRYKGSYTGQEQNFAGLATDEMYLVRAECYARAGNTASAMADLNTLRAKRYVNTAASPFVPLLAATPQEALGLVLAERRKELCFRGLRWTDLRRLNQEGRGITLKRIINGETYTLPPNDPYVSYSGIGDRLQPRHGAECTVKEEGVPRPGNALFAESQPAPLNWKCG